MALRPLSKLIRLSNMTVSVEKNGNKAHVTFPGFGVDDIDRTGNISVARVQKLLTTARIAAYHVTSSETGHTFLEYDKLTEDVFTFMGSTRTEVSRELYTLPDAPKMPHLLTTVHLGFVGNSSLNSVATLVDKDSGKELARNVNQVVTVSKTTRKPTPIADWWKDRYNSAVVDNERLVIAPIEVPENTHVYEVKVPWSEIDAYRHTNYVSYLKFCFDAAMDGMQAGFYSKFPAGEDIFKFHVKKLEISYKGESNAGDVLKVSTWENTENPYTLHFNISMNGKTINQNTMEFYQPLV